MDCTQVLVESDEEDNVAEEDDRRQVASLIVNEDSYPIFLGENKIGRDASTCSVVITSLALSSQHAVIQGLECGMFLICDLNSRNKTKIGKMTLTPNVRYQLKSGDVVRFANVSCTFLVERDVESNCTSMEKDIPSTQAIEGSDNEDEAGCSSGPGFTGKQKSLVKEDPGVNRNGVKSSKSFTKKSEEHIFKIPAVTPTRSINDSFGFLNESKDSSCHADSDDEIFELLTQPSSGEPAISELVSENDSNNTKSQESENVLPSGAESEKADDDDIFSAATEDYNVALKEMGNPLTIPKDTDDKDSDASDECGFRDDNGTFSAATEGFQTNWRKKKKVSGASSKTGGVKPSSALKEDEADDEEDIFSASTEGFHVQTLKKDTHKAGGMVIKDKDAWEEYGIADEDDIFSAAAEGFPSKSSKGNPRKSRESKGLGDNDTSKEDNITDEDDIFSAATEALPAEPSEKKERKIKSKDVIAKDGDVCEEGEITDEEDIFSAAPEALPAESSEKKVLKTKSKDVMVKDVDEEGDVTDEDDIFSAATETLPAESSGKKVLKTKSKDVVSKDGDVDEEGGVTDEDDIFSAATEAPPTEPSEKKVRKIKSKDVFAKVGDACEEGEITDEEDIFSAATEAFPPLQCKKKSSKTNPRNAVAKDGDSDEGDQVTDEDDIFSAATEALPAQSSTKKIPKTKSKKIIKNYRVLSEEDDVTDEEDIFSAATEALPALQSTKKASKTNSSNTAAKDSVLDEEGQVTDEEDIFSAATEALPVSHDGENSGSSKSKVVDLKGMQEKKGNYEDHRFVKDFLSISNSEHVARGGGGSTGQNSLLTGNEEGTSQKSACEKQSLVGNRVGKQAERETKALEMMSTLESDGGETDVEDDVNSYATDKKTKTQSALKNVVKESEKSSCDNYDAHKMIVKSASEYGLDGDGGSFLNDPNASIVVISDTDGEDEEESYINSTMEKSKENKTVESSAIRSNTSEFNTPVNTAKKETLASKDALETRLDQHSVSVNKTVMMTVDETLPTACVILTSKGSKPSEGTSVRNYTRGNKLNKVEKSDVQGDTTSKPAVQSTMGDTCVKNLISAPVSVQNQSNIVADKDEDEVLVAETPVCNRNLKRKKGPQVSPEKDVEEEEDMSSFLTEAPPEFMTPVVGVKKDSSGIEDISDFEIQPTPKSSVPCISRKEKGKVEGDDEEEDMSSFLTEAPPEFKTPAVGPKRMSSSIEDISDFEIHPTPKSTAPCLSKKEEGFVGDDGDEEDMSSFLTQAPPEFKTPESIVKKLITGEEDLSELLTQPAPISSETHTPSRGNDEEDMSSFLTEAPPDFKTPVIGVRKIIAEEDDDLSDFATQPAPKNVEEEQENEAEDMSSFLTEVPPEFKTPVAGVQKIVAEEEEDISNLMTQPAPRDEENEQEVNEREISSFHKELSPVFKTQMVGIPKINAEEEYVLSDMETQPAPKSGEQEQRNDEEDTNSFPNEAQVEFKTPKAVAQKYVEEGDDDWSDFATQPAPVSEEKHKEGEGEDKKLSLKAEPEFKIPKVLDHNVSSEKEQDEDFSDMATQPAPRCDEKDGEANKLAGAPSELKATKGSLQSVGSDGEDFSDLATQPAPVIEEEHEYVVEMNLHFPKATIKCKTLSRQDRSASEEDDLSELETQPAPGESFVHSKCVSGKMGGEETAVSLTRRKGDLTTWRVESEEEDLSLLDTQPAPTSPVPDDPCDKGRKRPPTVDQITKEVKSKGKASSAALSMKKLSSLRGKSHLCENIEAPKKVCHSPKGGRKAVNIFADLKMQIEEEDSSDTDFEFSMGLPDTPDLIASLQESGNRHVPAQTTRRNLFDSEQSGKSIAVPSTTSSKSELQAKTIASKCLKRKNESVQKEPIRRNVVKVSAQSKSTHDVKNRTSPPKKLKEVQKEPGHRDMKGKRLVSDSNGFDQETEVTMAGLNNMQKIKNGKSEKIKSKTKTLPLLREVVVTSTPIQSSVVSAEHSVTPSPGSGADVPPEKTSKPTRRGRRKGGVGKSDADHAANDVISPVVSVGDASDIEMPSSIKIDFPATKTDAPKKAHNLRLKKSSNSSVTVKGGGKRSKESELNLRSDTEILKSIDAIESSKGKSLRSGRKKSIPSSVVEVAPVTKVSNKSGKGRKKMESDAASPLSSRDILQPPECPEKPRISNESNKGRDYTGETSETSNVDGELSPVVFYGKNTKTEKSDKSAVNTTVSSVVPLSKKKPQANDSQSEGENRGTPDVFPEPIRRSGRDRKPKKRFSVDNNPAKPKKNKSDHQASESIPSSGRVVRGRKGLADTCTLSDSGMNSSQETAVSLDSTLIISRKRASDDDQCSRSDKKFRICDVGSPVKVATRGGNRQRDKHGSGTLKGSMGPPTTKSDEKPKLTDGNVLGSRKGPAITKGDSGDIKEVQNVKGDDGGGKRQRKKNPAIAEKPLRASTRSKVDEEASDAKAVHDQQGFGKGSRLRAKEGSSSERSQVTVAKESNSQVKQERSSRGRNADSIEKSRRGRNESTAANSSKMSSTSATTVVVEESKDEEPKRTASSRNSSTIRGRRRKISPVTVDKNAKKNKDDAENDEHLLPLKVAPLRISRGRIVSGSTKGSDDVAVDSPVYNRSLLGECILEEKMSSRVRNQKKESVNVLFTGLSDPKLNQIVERLGGSIVETPQNCTVLVTDRLRRTYKLLCAICRGIPVVTTQWLTQSSSSNKFLDPFEYLVLDKGTEKRFNFTLKSSLERARVKPLLTGYSFIATPSVKPPPEEVKGIVTCAGGQYVTSFKALESKVTPLCYVVSCAADSSVWDEYTEIDVKKTAKGRAQRRKGGSTKEEGTQAKLLGVEGLLVSVLRQKSDLGNKEFSLR